MPQNPNYDDEASAAVESMDQNESDDCDSGSRDISTVNTNRLKQIFDTYRNGVEQNGAKAGHYQVRTQKNAQKIAVYDMGMARTQFPAYMNRIYGRQQTTHLDHPISIGRQPYEMPNLTLFPMKKKMPKPEVSEEQKKQIQSGVIQKVEVQSSNTLPSLQQVRLKEQREAKQLQTLGTMPMAVDKPAFRLKRKDGESRDQDDKFRPMLAATTTKGFDNVRIEDDLTFRLSQTDDRESSSDTGDDQIDANSFIG